MKDMGVSLRTNPVESIYGAFPALLYLNPSLAKDLLVPLLDFQSSPRYKNAYAAPNLGSSYPMILGNTSSNSDTRSLAVESSGNMLIMAYAHAVKSGDGSLLSRYYTTLRSWADFLIENSLRPQNFITADDLSNPDVSNLAPKGILGIYSTAKINEAVKVPNNSYMDLATQLISSWKQLAVTNDHIDAIYGQPISWGLVYNIFPAIWLNTGLIEATYTLTLQAGFYAQQSNSDFGFNPDSSQQDAAYPHWTLMTAATIPDGLPSVRGQLIRSVYRAPEKRQLTWLQLRQRQPVAIKAIKGKDSKLRPFTAAVPPLIPLVNQRPDTFPTVKLPQLSQHSTNPRDTKSLPAGAAAPAIIVTSKHRAAPVLHKYPNRAHTDDPISTVGVSAVPAHPNLLPSSSFRIEQLRVEVEQLRRELDSFRDVAETLSGYS
ncbi:hypothetical protein P691DRAFT_762809 [Macrolepiota fuliginosa MF-IS2]|uniref:Glutaminase A central domain-containing protein n=1 Tax=Macrolepiota fuliginosa MF-IS2 TaxID=1400762 RepID=A0A9P6BYF6_9AGAR|nr:hypothetical protein P691DRAFT_762809 [Macrolepiota fuliginosa MF-IS2]